MQKSCLTVIGFLAVAALPAFAQEAEEGPPTFPLENPAVFTWDDEIVTVKLPDLAELTNLGPSGTQTKGEWYGKLGEADIWIELRAYPRVQFGFTEPDDITERIQGTLSDPERNGNPYFKYDDVELVEGAFGWTKYASVGHGDLLGKDGETGAVGEIFVFGACLEKTAYSLRVRAYPRLAEEPREKLREFLRKGIEGKCKPRDDKWSEKESEDRWETDIPNEKTREKLRKIKRTEHYIIFTNSSGGKLFAKKMEEFYDEVQKTYPFPEIEGRRLMPVFLFRTKEEYIDFYVHIHKSSRASAAKSKGHASGDYYATYYESPNDPTHIHEATHQIFKNRLRRSGGGSWFQEGVAEYVETSHNDRKAFARRAARDGKFIPFNEFVQIPSLISNKHVSAADAYSQAGSLIEFLRDSKFAPDKFQEFTDVIGALPRGNLPRIEQAIERVYGCNLAAIEKGWIDYWKK